MKKIYLTTIAIIGLTNISYAGYLENLIKSKTIKPIDMQGKNNQQNNRKVLDKNITNEKDLSLVLLSFEKQAEQEAILKKKLKEKIKKEKENLKKKESRKQIKKEKENLNFPSLEDQMKNFMVGKKNVPYTPAGRRFLSNQKTQSTPIKPFPSIYGIYCKNKKCYILGDHRIYKKGDKIGNKEITEITASFIRYKNGDQIWYTR